MSDNNPEKQENIRDDKGRFVPGISGNPDGRPKGKTITEVVRARAEAMGDDGKPLKEKLADVLITMAMNGDLRALELIWNYLDGKPKQEIDIGDTSEIEGMRNELNDLIKNVKTGTAKTNTGRKKNMPLPSEPVSN